MRQFLADRGSFGLVALLALASVMVGSTASMAGRAASVPDGTRRPTVPVVWRGQTPSFATVPQTISIVGTRQDGRFHPEYATFPDVNSPVEKMTSLPLATDLLGEMHARPFGLDGRVEVHRNGGAIDIACSAGDRPAGVVFSPEGRHFPRGGAFALSIVSKGAAFGVSVVAAGADAPEPPDAMLVEGEKRLSLADGLTARETTSNDVVLTCPTQPATTRLSSMKLVALAQAPRHISSGTWVWQIGPWLENPEELASRATNRGIDRVWVQADISEGRLRAEGRFSTLVRTLRDHGIRVAAVEGDPVMISGRGLDNALERVQALRLHGETYGPNAGLDGLQFDIEPYLVNGYASDPARYWRQWSRAIDQLARAWEDKVSLVLPFWMLDAAGGRKALDRVRSAVSGITVMAYRTNVGEVTVLSEPLLYWGARNGIPVTVALENGALPQEFQRSYVRAPRGQVRLSSLDDGGNITLFAHPVTGNPATPAYTFSHETPLDIRRVTFDSDTRRLEDTRAELERVGSAWQSFKGMAIHEALR